MRRGPVLLLLAAACSQFGCSSYGEFWDRPYAVASHRVVAAPPARIDPAPPPPVAYEPPPPPAPSYADPTLDVDRATLGAVNRIRGASGLRPFRWNDRLHAAARDHSAEQRLHGYMGHGSPDAGRDDLGDRIRIAGYRGRAWAEVVAKGYTDVPSVVDAWMKSRPHREILLDPELEEAGFSRDGIYWTGNFGSPLSPAPCAVPRPVARPSSPPPPPRPAPPPTSAPRPSAAPT